MMRRTALVVGAVLVTISVVFIAGMREKSPVVLDAVRRVNRRVFNPRQLRTAGEPGAYASLIRHTGRSSGTSYRTPIVAVPTDDGFVVALPYGSRADWLRNVLAAGSATIVHDGSSYEVDRPEVVPIESAAASFSAPDRRSHRLFGVDQCLRVRRVDHGDG